MPLQQRNFASRGSSPAALAGALALAALALGGCLMQPSVAVSVTAADGQKLEVPLSTAPAPVTDEVVTVNSLQFAPWEADPDKPKTLAYTFVVQFKPGAVPAKIVIEDDTEDPILQIFEDDNPKFAKANIWGGFSRPFAPDDEHVQWMLNLDNNVRVYRFTATLKDGTVHVLYKPVFIPAAMKAFMRRRLGIK